jgi:hypothetical protein
MMVVGPLGRQALLHLLATTVLATATTVLATATTVLATAAVFATTTVFATAATVFATAAATTAAAATDHHSGVREVGGAGEGDHAQRRRDVGAQGVAPTEAFGENHYRPGVAAVRAIQLAVAPQMKGFGVRDAPRLASA